MEGCDASDLCATYGFCPFSQNCSTWEWGAFSPPISSQRSQVSMASQPEELAQRLMTCRRISSNSADPLMQDAAV
jgi:hypothetical protein